MDNSCLDKYSDIIDMPRPEIFGRAKMSLIDRAAQFSPFSALTGYDSAVAEVARLTESRHGISDYAADEINRVLQLLSDIIDTEPRITLTYFLQDERKQGGRHVNLKSRLVNMDEGRIMLKSGDVIPIDSITHISADVFDEMCSD